MKIEKYVRPNSLKEAYDYINDNKKAVLMAGGVFLKLQKRKVPLAVDLSDLGLSYIKENESAFHLGAMTSLRMIEVSEALPESLKQSVKQIGGVGLRNLVTVGGSICGAYPFSDVTTGLLALNPTLVFYNEGEISLEKYLESPRSYRDLLVEVVVPKVKFCVFKCFKQVYTDFSLINVAIAFNEEWRIVIGARPEGPRVIKVSTLEGALDNSEFQSVHFGSDHRGSGAYRRSLAISLLEDAFEEVTKWK